MARQKSILRQKKKRSIHPDIFFGIMDVWQWMPVTTQRKRCKKYWIYNTFSVWQNGHGGKSISCDKGFLRENDRPWIAYDFYVPEGGEVQPAFLSGTNNSGDK